jgi:mRNA interferase YafQ
MMKRGLEIDKLDAVMADLVASRPLSPQRRDHSLSGDWRGHRDCHVQSDWILLYRIDFIPPDSRGEGDPLESVTFVRTGTHSDLLE